VWRSSWSRTVWLTIAILVALVLIRLIQMEITTRHFAHEMEDFGVVQRVVLRMFEDGAVGVVSTEGKAPFVSTIASLRSYAESQASLPATSAPVSNAREVLALLNDSGKRYSGRVEPATQPSDMLLWSTVPTDTFEGPMHRAIMCNGETTMIRVLPVFGVSTQPAREASIKGIQRQERQRIGASKP
jgi:hypothetical protein